jgi:hypothetical protein
VVPKKPAKLSVKILFCKKPPKKNGRPRRGVPEAAAPREEER